MHAANARCVARDPPLLRRLPIPDNSLAETFDLAFGDADAAAAARIDPLIGFEAPRARFLTQGLAATKEVQRRAHEFTKPLLVWGGGGGGGEGSLRRPRRAGQGGV